MAVIELPDNPAAALQAKAALEVLTLNDWLQKLAGQHMEEIHRCKKTRSLN